MTQNKFRSATRGEQGWGQSRILWIGVGAAVLLFLIVAFFVSRASSIPFEMTGGEVNPVVLLRNESTVYYNFEYTGSKPAELQKAVPRIQLFQGQILTVDVQAVYIRFNGQQIRLEDGFLPEGTAMELQPGDTFDIGVTYLGQELGWNRIYGFRLQYAVEGQPLDAELELSDDYYVFVE